MSHKRDYPTTQEHVLEAKRMCIVVQEAIDDEEAPDGALDIALKLGMLHAVTAIADILAGMVVSDNAGRYRGSSFTR